MNDGLGLEIANSPFGKEFFQYDRGSTLAFSAGDLGKVWEGVPPPLYLIFVIFSPHAQFFVNIFSTPKCVYCDKTDFVTKQRESRQN